MAGAFRAGPGEDDRVSGRSTVSTDCGGSGWGKQQSQGGHRQPVQGIPEGMEGAEREDLVMGSHCMKKVKVLAKKKKNQKTSLWGERFQTRTER